MLSNLLRALKDRKWKRVVNKFCYFPKIKSYGKNNVINIDKTASTRRVTVEIYGDNNTVIVDEGAYLHNFSIRIGFPNCFVENCVVKIGKNTSINSALIQLGESDSKVEIGSECMFSYGIEINCTDQHCIFDENDNLLNVGKSVTIGSHVWVCKKVTIMKNTNVPDGCILAEGCVVTKSFEKPNCVIAGVPARVTKENIRWERERPQNYLRKNS